MTVHTIMYAAAAYFQCTYLQAVCRLVVCCLVAVWDSDSNMLGSAHSHLVKVQSKAIHDWSQ